ncbi:hypothetical protein KJ761_00320 [Patescibacteria group bacterium]|nr:hypothetical protein [Patescibacteria group bacterium]
MLKWILIVIGLLLFYNLGLEQPFILRIIGAVLLVLTIPYYIWGSEKTSKKPKKKKGRHMLGGLLLTATGILIFLSSLFIQSRLDGRLTFWTGMIISAIGMFLILRKIFKNV